ncbi:MAG: cation:dicarboxylase symporter family transporter [Pirellulaceae bacterium]
MKLELHWQILIGMLLGASIGIAVNSRLSTRQTELSAHLPPGVQRASVDDSADLIEIRWTTTSGDEETRVVDPTGRTDDCVLTVEDLARQSPVAAQIFEMAPSLARQLGAWCKRLGGLFLRMLQMVSVPLIVASLASGVLGLGGGRGFGRMFSTTLAYYVCTSLLAILTGLAVTNVFNPGIGTDLRLDVAQAQVSSSSISEVIMSQIETMIPTNPIAAIAESSFLSVISFTIVFCIFALQVGGETLRRFRELAEDSFAVMMRLTTAVIKLAPLGSSC